MEFLRGYIAGTPGTYNENVMITKEIILASTDGPEVTIIDADGLAGTVLKLNNFSTADYYGYPEIHADITVDGFTIQNGSAISSETLVADYRWS